MPTPRKLFAVFREFPKELFRVNNGLTVKLRVWAPQLHVYDIFVRNGMVEPKALNPKTYLGKLEECTRWQGGINTGTSSDQ
jgi:hypothetical protein